MKKISLFLFLLIAIPVYATDEFVDRDASCVGDNGDTGTPWCTIQDAMNVVNPGDRIKIRDSASCYDANSIITRSGTAANPIIIEPDTGHNPCIRYSGANASTGAIVIRASYITVQNLTFNAAGINPSKYGVWADAPGAGANLTGIKILTNTFTNWVGTNANRDNFAGVLLQGTETSTRSIQSALVQGNTFSTVGRSAVRLSYSFSSVVENNTVTGMKCGQGSDGNPGITVFKDTDDGGGSASTGNIFRYNKVTSLDTDCTGVTPGTGGVLFAAFYCDTGPKFGQVIGNYIDGVGPAGGGSNDAYMGIIIESRCTDWKVHSNVILNVGTYGFRNGSPSTSNPDRTEFVKNTIVGVKGKAIWVARGGSLVIKDNVVDILSTGTIAIDFDANAVTSGGHTIDYNLYYDGGAGTKIGQWNVTGVLTFANWKANCGCDANSLNTNHSLNSNGTQTSSFPGKDLGTTHSGILCNGTCDIGRYESINSPAPTCSVEDGDANTIRVTFTNNPGQPIQTGAVTGITIQVATLDRTESSPAVTGTNSIFYTIDGAGITAGQAVTWAAASTNTITDSSDAGAPTVAQGLHATGTINCANNVSGSPTLLTQSHFRLTRENNQISTDTDISLQLGSILFIEFQVDGDGGTGISQGNKVQMQKDGGTFFDVPDAFGGDCDGAPCKVKFFGNTETSPFIPVEGTPLTTCLSAGGRTELAGTVQRTSAAIPNVAYLDATCVRLGYAVVFATDAEIGDVYRARLFNQQGVALSAYTSSPDITITDFPGPVATGRTQAVGRTAAVGRTQAATRKPVIDGGVLDVTAPVSVLIGDGVVSETQNSAVCQGTTSEQGTFRCKWSIADDGVYEFTSPGAFCASVCADTMTGIASGATRYGKACVTDAAGNEGCSAQFTFSTLPANTIYVGKSGSDANSCATAQSPTAGNRKLTIAAGLGCLTASEDTLIVGDGTYVEGINDIIPPGTGVLSRTKIQAENNKQAIIRPTTGVGPSSRAVIYTTKSYTDVDGFVIDASGISPSGGSLPYYVAGGTGGIIQNSEIKATQGTTSSNCVTIQGTATNWTIKNNDIHDCGNPASNLAHGIYLWNQGHIVESNDIGPIGGGHGVHLFKQTAPREVSNNIIRYNTIHQTGRQGIGVYSGNDNQVYGNTIVDHGQAASVAGIRIGTGFSDGEADRTKAYNNTIYSGNGLCAEIGGGSFQNDTELKNTFCLDNSNNTITNNGVNSTLANNTTSTDDTLVEDAPGGDFKPRSGSALRNAGTQTGLPSGYSFLGANPDIGCCEFVE